jgi:HD-like signal output (HDOD) protein
MSTPRSAHPATDDALHGELIERIDSGSLDLPLLSDTAAKVMELCGDASCDARRLAELIQRDQGLAGHVLRVANSAAYAPTERIVSLQQAVSRMGLTAMRDIALAIAIRGKVFIARRAPPRGRRRSRAYVVATSRARSSPG